VSDPWFTRLRGRSDFDALIERARVGYEAAIDAFKRADGERILGLTIAV
jgi:hypothetical protein